MQQDIRDSALFREAESLCCRFRKPSTGAISDAGEVSTHGSQVVFSATLVDRLSGSPPTRIGLLDLATGGMQILTFGPNDDRMPKFSPDGNQIAFLSDRHAVGDYQLFLLDPVTSLVRATERVEGWVEYLHWSPDGQRILLGVAGRGADVSGGQGAVTTSRVENAPPAWVPSVTTGDENCRWRRVWIYDLVTDRARLLGTEWGNVWEAVWCGNDALAAIVSVGPDEGLWYSATLQILNLNSGQYRPLYRPKDQLGWPCASPSGTHLAVVEALCSDRWIVAGNLLLIRTVCGTAARIDTHSVDITYTQWCSDRDLLLAGHRGFETVVALYNVGTETFREVWCSRDITTGGRYAAVSGLNDSGDCVLVGEGFTKAPEIAQIRNGQYRPVRSFDHGYGEYASTIQSVEAVTWNAPDGQPIQGWLLTPQGQNPYPVIMYLHGGPVWHWRPFWLGRGAPTILMLLKRGYAIFFPNPRGSSGRGQHFARQVIGNMGGADAQDCLSGIDYLVSEGVADPYRLGVTGGSYGGFMTSWLITQDTRFAAAVSVSPVTNQVTLHLLSNIPHFARLFLDDVYTRPAGAYFHRSPIMYAQHARTPTLNICGALDRCTPPEEAQQFHGALKENGVKSALIVYPQEGHGVRHWPTLFDYAARIVSWFEEHLTQVER